MTSYEAEMTEMQVAMMRNLENVTLEVLEEVSDDGIVVVQKVRVTEVASKDANNVV